PAWRKARYAATPVSLRRRMVEDTRVAGQDAWRNAAKRIGVTGRWCGQRDFFGSRFAMFRVGNVAVCPRPASGRVLRFRPMRGGEGWQPRQLASAPESTNTVAAFRPWRGFRSIV